MSSSFIFTKYDEPEETELGAFGSGIATTLIAAGIVNPMGPTLNILAMDGLGSPGATLKLFFVSLNPFSQSCHEVGEVLVGDVWVPQHDLMPFLNGWGGCPTLLIPSALYAPEVAEELFTQFLRTFEDGRETLQQLRKYPGDPWTRVKQEMDGTAEMLEKLLNGDSGEISEDGHLDGESAADFARLQMDPKNLKEEFDAFMFAWEGSTNFLRLPSIAKEEFFQVFTRLAMTARVPFMSNIIDNPEMLHNDPYKE